MRGTIALIVASLNCAMHSTQCDAARFRQKPALQVTSLISLPFVFEVVFLEPYDPIWEQVCVCGATVRC